MGGVSLPEPKSVLVFLNLIYRSLSLSCRSIERIDLFGSIAMFTPRFQETGQLLLQQSTARKCPQLFNGPLYGSELFHCFRVGRQLLIIKNAKLNHIIQGETWKSKKWPGGADIFDLLEKYQDAASLTNLKKDYRLDILIKRQLFVLTAVGTLERHSFLLFAVRCHLIFPKQKKAFLSFCFCRVSAYLEGRMFFLKPEDVTSRWTMSAVLAGVNAQRTIIFTRNLSLENS